MSAHELLNQRVLAEFRHEALIYDDAEEFLAGAAPYVREGLDAGEPVLVAVSQVPRALLEEELGGEAAAVRFAEMETLGRNPARIIPFWRQFVEECEGQAVRGIGEPVWPGRAHCEIDECQRHEALLNVAFAGSPAWTLLCPYDAGALDEEVIGRIADSHQHIAGKAVPEGVCGYLDQVDCFAGEFPGRPPVMDEVAFSADGLAQVRRRLEEAAELAAIPRERVADLVLATSELAANSVAHGGGTGTFRVWRTGERLVVEVEDEGLIEEPLVGRIRPTGTQLSGRGLWLANQLCDLVQIRSGVQGTAVRLHVALA